jgi:hypothetical protein
MVFRCIIAELNGYKNKYNEFTNFIKLIGISVRFVHLAFGGSEA